MTITYPKLLTSELFQGIIEKIILNKPLTDDESYLYKFYEDAGFRCSTCRNTVGLSLSGDRDQYFNWLSFWILNEAGDELACPKCGPDQEE